MDLTSYTGMTDDEDFAGDDVREPSPRGKCASKRDTTTTTPASRSALNASEPPMASVRARSKNRKTSTCEHPAWASGAFASIHPHRRRRASPVLHLPRRRERLIARGVADTHTIVRFRARARVRYFRAEKHRLVGVVVRRNDFLPQRRAPFVRAHHLRPNRDGVSQSRRARVLTMLDPRASKRAPEIETAGVRAAAAAAAAAAARRDSPERLRRVRREREVIRVKHHAVRIRVLDVHARALVPRRRANHRRSPRGRAPFPRASRARARVARRAVARRRARRRARRHRRLARARRPRAAL